MARKLTEKTEIYLTQLILVNLYTNLKSTNRYIQVINYK